MKQNLTETELKTFEIVYKSATGRKQVIFILLTLFAIASMNLLFSFESFAGWQKFLGCGTIVIVYGVIGVFTLINDTAHDIITSMRPDLEED